VEYKFMNGLSNAPRPVFAGQNNNPTSFGANTPPNVSNGPNGPHHDHGGKKPSEPTGRSQIGIKYLTIGNFVNKSDYQAVFVNVTGSSGGQAYFGKITSISPQYIVLDDVFYLEPGSTSNQFTLNNLNCALYSPNDTMVVNMSQVDFWENLASTSQVTKDINTYNSKNLKCGTASTATSDATTGTTGTTATTTPTPTTGTTDSKTTTPTPTPTTGTTGTTTTGSKTE
jgi:hypothetical protein